MEAVQWFRRGGEGRALVFLHGFTGAPASWQPVIHALPEATAAAGLALPGHHPRVPVVPGFEANVDRMASALEAAGLGGCHLVGYSLGARTALGLALRHPRLVGRVSLVGAHPGLHSVHERRLRVDKDRGWIDLLRHRGLDAFLDAWERQPIFATQGGLSADMLARQRRTRAAHDPEALARSLEHMGLGVMPDYGSRLVELSMPVAWIAGEQDEKFARLARAAAERLASAGRRATLALVPGSGHNVPLERPIELAALLSDARPAGLD